MRTDYLYTRKQKIAKWGMGPWLDEPDYAEWTDVETGLPCIVMRNRVGTFCGYFGVPKNHPWFAITDYDVIGLPHVEVSFTGLSSEEGMVAINRKTGERAVFGVKSSPDFYGYRYFGWDSAHAGDYMPEIEFLRRGDNPMLTALRAKSPPSVLAHLDEKYPPPVVPLASVVGSHGWSGMEKAGQDVYNDFVFIRKECTLAAKIANNPHLLELREISDAEL